jgi:hypothetical protein
MSDLKERAARVATGSPFGDRAPLSPWDAARAVARSASKTAVLLTKRRIRQPTLHVGDVIGFADGTSAAIYRETVVQRARTREPVVLVVSFRLRWVRGRWHTTFRAESLLNTPLFVGFEGFVSKLWLRHDQLGRYRGLYEWDGASLADSYVRALWWVLRLVCTRGSIHYAVVPGIHLDDLLNNPSLMGRSDRTDWWRLDRVDLADQ